MHRRLAPVPFHPAPSPYPGSCFAFSVPSPARPSLRFLSIARPRRSFSLASVSGPSPLPPLAPSRLRSRSLAFSLAIRSAEISREHALSAARGYMKRITPRGAVNAGRTPPPPSHPLMRVSAKVRGEFPRGCPSTRGDRVQPFRPVPDGSKVQRGRSGSLIARDLTRRRDRCYDVADDGLQGFGKKLLWGSSLFRTTDFSD